ncbi:phage tail sheath C-terminal domain-containing protein [Tenacibaculum sp. 1_MG-2023]|uniref:phage tail sheath family protein n=1 Tax=Tenacibaculum sp. 1_MG-2023 TaxID=3062653 RepID=UPI0026E2CCBD|nr:phage tail sheath C-terminal domain-containing protein [Tenacibaculum sp. 1_MG-2023]MDO6675269.1 phage tail sheath C-terminal domain-containing protein [Tenacibaculum sp. 1_MG-2023]
MSAYKTPGVYVEEIVKFPPSVAQVETAIPAFIGYTEKAKKKEDNDLLLEPKRITSMLEYETYFGFSEKETTIGVNVTNANQANEEVLVTQPSNPSPFKMYYNMQMYFANGGGPCYVTSVGTYTSARTNNNTNPILLEEVGNNGFKGLKEGLEAIEYIDEVTLLVFSDATSLTSDADFYSLYSLALTQCNKLQDRFAIIDTYSDKEYDDGGGDVDPVEALRSKLSLGKDYLKYGAAYFPYLNTILDFSYDEDSIDIQGLEESLSVQADNVIDGINLTELDGLLTVLVDTKNAIDGAGNEVALTFKNDAISSVKNIISYLEDITTSINDLVSEAEDSGEASLTAPSTSMTTWMDSNLEAILADLHGKIFKLQQDDTEGKLIGSLTSNATNVFDLLGITDEVDMTNNGIYTSLENQTTTNELFALKGAIDGLGGVTTLPSLADLKVDNNALYNKIKSEIGLLPVKLAPSATMAGIYAKVDSDRGVWKAPANVGLNYVYAPSVNISHDAQKDLNVDTVAGKSINAIRSFVGKGNLVWGARTLAGNDNEWRYVSVRRFFNMAEESIKKASEQFVFEPNDKNTWVRVKAMIDNFLTQQWRAGALAGPTPEKAFYVSVGLGETMTTQDVLEGNMIIEIGMAVVRPAEFIILKFSHKMQEA